MTNEKELRMAKPPKDPRPHEGIQEEHETHLLDYLFVIVRRKWVLVISFCAVMTLVAVFTFLETPIYRAVCKIRVYTEAPKVLQFDDVTDRGGVVKRSS